ncbi:serine/arginine repetitive matrix protein 1-like [Saccostrea cucullata]|uniref:serine/arginine repetitive matrix protein 1-like n=1 Tax=Saccostrea cuccullata TaxID=36930 RepID=UPI002ED0A1EB
MPEQRVYVSRPVMKRTLPRTPSDTETETDSESVTSYCSTCTQTTASTNIIDERNRVIRRKVVRNPQVLRAIIERPPRDKITRKEYVKPIENSMETKQYLLKKHLTDSAKYQGKGVESSNYENVNLVRKPGRRPGSASSVRAVRTIRTVASSPDEPVRRRIILREAEGVHKTYDDGHVMQRVIRRVEREEPKRVVVVRRPVTSEREGRVVRRIITRSRPSSYNGRDGGEPIIIRRERPSSYHAGMADEYEPVQADETSETTEDEREQVVREYRLQNNETRAVKQLEGDRWVDEYDVPDVEKRNVGVQMTTNYVVPKPPEKESRTIGTQTKIKKEKPPPREPTPPPRIPTPPPRIPTPPPPKPKKKRQPQPPPPKIKTPEPEPVPVKQKLPPPLPVIYKKKSRHQYVRVGGGWMKIDHYRNHHVPLRIYEHKREAANNKFLSVKYRYTKDKKKTPVAWAKYRGRVASES